MSWLFPAGIVSALALVAIVVLHMRHRLPDVVRFPQLSFWPRVPSESRESPRWRRPPLSTLFILQLLAALLLVLAFMRPALPDLGIFGGQRTSAIHHVVVLDGSTSMLASSADGVTRWDAARDRADAVLMDWQQGDGVTVIVAAARPVVRSAADDRDLADLRDWLVDLPLPGGAPDATAVSRLLGTAALPDLDRAVTLVTDGGLELDDAGAPFDRVTVGEPDAANVAILSVTTSPIDGGGQLIEATALQDRDGTETLPWVATAGDQTVGSGTITLAAGQTGTFSVRAPAGTEQVTLEIATEDALAADNRAVVPLAGDALTGMRVVLVSDVPGPTLRALEVLPGAVVESYPTTTPGIAGIAATADLVVYEASVPSPGDVPDVPMLFVQPSGMSDAWQVAGVAPDPFVTEARLDDPVLRDVALDGVRFGETPIYVLEAGTETLASGAEADLNVPLVWRGTLAGQPYLAYAFDPAASNIADRVTFPVLVAQSVFSLAGSGAGGIVAPGDRVTLPVTEDTARVRVVSPSGATLALTPDRLATGEAVAAFTATADPGVWSVAVEDAEGAEISSGAVVVAIGHPEESRLRSGAPVMLDPSAGQLGAGGAAGEGRAETLADVWPLLVLGAVLLIGLEWWLWLARSLGGRRTPEGQSP
jgi:Ca-activated chloride channel homolog